MKRLAILALLAALVSSCGGDPPIVPAFAPPPTTAPVVVEPTSPPEPTEAPTPPPLDKIDLVAVLADVSALPKGLTAGKTLPKAPDYQSAVPRPAAINSAELTVLHGKDNAGNVVIYIYDDGAKANDSYTSQKTLLGLIGQQSGDKVESPDDIGKQASVISITVGQPGTFLEFIRCRAVVDIALNSDIADNKNVAAYAKDLDTRLMPLVCQ